MSRLRTQLLAVQEHDTTGWTSCAIAARRCPSGPTGGERWPSCADARARGCARSTDAAPASSGATSSASRTRSPRSTAKAGRSRQAALQRHGVATPRAAGPAGRDRRARGASRQLEDQELELMDAARAARRRAGWLVEQQRADARRAGDLAAARRSPRPRSTLERRSGPACSPSERRLASAVARTLLAEYERCVRAWTASAIARLVGAAVRRLPPRAVRGRARPHQAAPPDEPVHCEECGRLLAR